MADSFQFSWNIYVNPAILKKLIEVENSKEFKITKLFTANLILSTYLL